jgi:hypothetical protein
MTQAKHVRLVGRATDNSSWIAAGIMAQPATGTGISISKPATIYEARDKLLTTCNANYAHARAFMKPTTMMMHSHVHAFNFCTECVTDLTVRGAKLCVILSFFLSFFLSFVTDLRPNGHLSNT